MFSVISKKVSPVVTTAQPKFYVKKGVSFHEYQMHLFAYSLSLKSTLFQVPKVIEYNSVDKTMTMEKINADNISNVYGEELDNVPPTIIKEIRKIIRFLRDNGIMYPDITGYNFIFYNNKIWMIDFEHSYFDGFENRNYDFIKLFINGEPTWNPDFM
jgi:RIO-like serine/threonine protein kinase